MPRSETLATANQYASLKVHGVEFVLNDGGPHYRWDKAQVAAAAVFAFRLLRLLAVATSARLASASKAHSPKVFRFRTHRQTFEVWLASGGRLDKRDERVRGLQHLEQLPGFKRRRLRKCQQWQRTWLAEFREPHELQISNRCVCVRV